MELLEEMMKKISFTKFRENASSYLDDVEEGKSIQIFRHGKVIAEIVPPSGAKGPPAWKKEGLRLTAKGAGLSLAIIDERKRHP